MKKLISITAAILAAGFISVTAQAQTPDANRYRESIQVNGKAEKRVAPDEIYVAITLRTGDVKNMNVDQIESMMKTQLTAIGVDIAAALRVTTMSNAPRRRNDVDSNRSYELKVGDTQTLDAVFALLGDMGVSDARVSRVGHSRMEEFRNEVRVEAIRNARAIACTLAEAVGQSAGAAVWIADNGYYENSPMPVMTRSFKADAIMFSGVADVAEPGLDMQDITLTYNVTAEFILLRD
ncbi:MAG: SIMPL domain-containing protein [Alistipes sp.]|jgi:uncharacterized protein YggE|nr:SIMPL domain-containing protein [Alistipes sp.]